MEAIIFFKPFVLVVFFILISNSLFSQAKEKWTITKVVDLFLQRGIANPADDDFINEKKLYLKRTIYKQGNMLFFSAALKKSASYADTIFIGECQIFPKKKDDDISYRYPGDELTCPPILPNENKCFVGESFLKMLGSSNTSLRVCKSRGNYPNFFSYKLCIVQENKKMGLLLENSLTLLILEPERTVHLKK
jgi:hypothetical protein